MTLRMNELLGFAQASSGDFRYGLGKGKKSCCDNCKTGKPCCGSADHSHDHRMLGDADEQELEAPQYGYQYVQTTVPGKTVFGRPVGLVPAQRKIELTRLVEELEWLAGTPGIHPAVLAQKIWEVRRRLMGSADWEFASYAEPRGSWDSKRDLLSRVEAVERVLGVEGISPKLMSALYGMTHGASGLGTYPYQDLPRWTEQYWPIRKLASCIRDRICHKGQYCCPPQAQYPGPSWCYRPPQRVLWPALPPPPPPRLPAPFVPPPTLEPVGIFVQPPFGTRLPPPPRPPRLPPPPEPPRLPPPPEPPRLPPPPEETRLPPPPEPPRVQPPRLPPLMRRLVGTNLQPVELPPVSRTVPGLPSAASVRMAQASRGIEPGEVPMVAPLLAAGAFRPIIEVRGAPARMVEAVATPGARMVAAGAPARIAVHGSPTQRTGPVVMLAPPGQTGAGNSLQIAAGRAPQARIDVRPGQANLAGLSGSVADLLALVSETRRQIRRQRGA